MTRIAVPRGNQWFPCPPICELTASSPRWSLLTPEEQHVASQTAGERLLTPLVCARQVMRDCLNELRLARTVAEWRERSERLERVKAVMFKGVDDDGIRSKYLDATRARLILVGAEREEAEHIAPELVESVVAFRTAGCWQPFQIRRPWIDDPTADIRDPSHDKDEQAEAERLWDADTLLLVNGSTLWKDRYQDHELRAFPDEPICPFSTARGPVIDYEGRGYLPAKERVVPSGFTRPGVELATQHVKNLLAHARMLILRATSAERMTPNQAACTAKTLDELSVELRSGWASQELRERLHRHRPGNYSVAGVIRPSVHETVEQLAQNVWSAFRNTLNSTSLSGTVEFGRMLAGPWRWHEVLRAFPVVKRDQPGLLSALDGQGFQQLNADLERESAQLLAEAATTPPDTMRGLPSREMPTTESAAGASPPVPDLPPPPVRPSWNGQSSARCALRLLARLDVLAAIRHKFHQMSMTRIPQWHASATSEERVSRLEVRQRLLDQWHAEFREVLQVVFPASQGHPPEVAADLANAAIAELGARGKQFDQTPIRDAEAWIGSPNAWLLPPTGDIPPHQREAWQRFTTDQEWVALAGQIRRRFLALLATLGVVPPDAIARRRQHYYSAYHSGQQEPPSRDELISWLDDCVPHSPTSHSERPVGSSSVPSTPPPRPHAGLQPWEATFQLLKTCFQEAGATFRHVHIRLSTPLFSETDRDREWVCNECPNPERTGRSYQTAPPLFGFAESVEEFRRLATLAGNSLPTEFRPAPPIFRTGHPLSRDELQPVLAWCEFLAVAQSSHFIFREQNQAYSGHLQRDADPFLLSAAAIDAFLLTDDPHEAVRRYLEFREAVAPRAAGNVSPTTQIATASEVGGPPVDLLNTIHQGMRNSPQPGQPGLQVTDPHVHLVESQVTYFPPTRSAEDNSGGLPPNSFPAQNPTATTGTLEAEKPKERGGRPRLGEGPNASPKDKALRNVYDLIRPLRKQGLGPQKLIDHFKKNPDLKKRVEQAGKKINVAFFRAAISWLDDNPDQETPSENVL